MSNVLDIIKTKKQKTRKGCQKKHMEVIKIFLKKK